MNNAPERIWTQREFHSTSCRGSASTHETVCHAVPYLRRDIADELLEALIAKTVMDPDNSNSTWLDAKARAAIARATNTTP